MSTCGVGGGNFPQPGDPDLNNQILSASSGTEGISVRWTYPAANAHAVAHTRLYSSTGNSSFASASLLEIVSGSYFFHRLKQENVGTTYYYWIEMVSINGTVGDVIGPASAVLQPSISEIIALLSGQINASQLSQDLRTQIGTITDISSNLSDEQQERIAGQNVITQLLAGYQGQLEDIDTLVVNEITERITGDSALVAEVGLLLTKTGENTAAIQVEKIARTTPTTGIAARLDTIQVALEDGFGSVEQVAEVMAGPDGITAKHTIKTEANGYISGYGLFNSGPDEGSDFIIHADRFAIGKPLAAGADPTTDVTYPFIIAEVNGQTQIALNARTLIPDAHIENAMISDLIHSNNWDINDPFGEGWAIHKSGLANFSNVKVRGDIEASTLKANAVMVNTANIAGNAVIVPASTNQNNEVSLNGSWQVVASLLNLPVGVGVEAPSNIFVQAFCNIHTVTGPFLPGGDINYSDLFLRLRTSQGAVGGTVVTAPLGTTTLMNVFDAFTNHQGNVSFYLEAYVVSGGRWVARNSGIFIQGVRR